MTGATYNGGAAWSDSWTTALLPLPPQSSHGPRLHPDVEAVAWIFAQALYRSELERQEAAAQPMLIRPLKRNRRRKTDD